jgi:hypothetical protein
MPYCSSAIKLNKTSEWKIDEALNTLARDSFQAEAAHHINDNQYNIDAGLNDVRAIVDAEERLLCFICRYEKDIPKTTDTLAQFVFANAGDCHLVDVDHKGRLKG